MQVEECRRLRLQTYQNERPSRSERSWPESTEVTGILVVLRSARAEDLTAWLKRETTDTQSRLSAPPPDPSNAKSAAAWLQQTGALARAGIGDSFVIADQTTDDAVGRISMFLRAKAPDGRTGYLEEAHGVRTPCPRGGLEQLFQEARRGHIRSRTVAVGRLTIP
jgi:hypothetical protein